MLGYLVQISGYFEYNFIYTRIIFVVVTGIIFKRNICFYIDRCIFAFTIIWQQITIYCPWQMVWKLGDQFILNYIWLWIGLYGINLKWLHLLLLVKLYNISLVNRTGKGKKMPTLFVCFCIIVFLWIFILIQSVAHIVLPIWYIYFGSTHDRWKQLPFLAWPTLINCFLSPSLMLVYYVCFWQCTVSYNTKEIEGPLPQLCCTYMCINVELAILVCNMYSSYSIVKLLVIFVVEMTSFAYSCYCDSLATKIHFCCNVQKTDLTVFGHWKGILFWK
jgi:hypothetical protein